jgi:signal recognition particle subunit SEC65
MPPYIFEGKFQDKTSVVRVKLLLFHFQDENKVHFVYSPHLDLTGYGNDENQAKKSFEVVMEDFVDYTVKKKTIAKVLADLGWEVKGSEKHPRKLLAPSITTVINENEYISEIFDKYSVNTFHEEIGLPV